MAQPSVRAVTAVDVSSSSQSAAKPTGTVQGDILLACVSDTSGTLANIGTPTGGAAWTLLSSRDDSALKSKLFWKVAGGAEPSTYGFTFSGSTFDATVTVIAVQDGAAATPTVANVSSGSGASVNTPGLTPPDAVSLEIRYAVATAGEFGFEWSSVPASYTEIAPLEGSYTVSCAAWRQLPSGSATSTLAFTASETPSGTRHGFTVAIGQGSLDASASLTTVTATTTVPTPAVSAGSNLHPDTVTAVTAVPAPAVGAGSNINLATVTAATAVPTPSITTDTAELVGLDTVTAATTVPTPSVGAGAGVTLATVTGTTAVPAPAVSSDASIVLPTVAVTAAVPSIAVSVPILPGDQLDGSPGQMEWNGFVLGRTSFYRWRQLEGWRGKEPPDSGNAAHANRHGSAPGRPLAREKVVTWNGFIKASREEVEAAVLALETATPLLRDSTQWPLVANDLGTPYLAYGRIDRVHIPLDKLARLGHIPIIVQWIMADTRRYNINATGVTCVKNVITDVGNAGNTETNPLIVIPGPAVTPRMTNHTLNRVLEFGVTLLDGEELIIDTDLGRARVGSTDVMGVRSFSSVSVWDWVLDRGTQQVEFTTASGGTQAEVLYRDAWI